MTKHSEKITQILEDFAKAPVVKSLRIPGGKKFFRVGQIYIAKVREHLWEGFDKKRAENCSWLRQVGPVAVSTIDKGTKILCLSKPQWLSVGHPHRRTECSSYVKLNGKLVTLVYRKYIVKVLINEKIGWMIFHTDESPSAALRKLKSR